MPAKRLNNEVYLIATCRKGSVYNFYISSVDTFFGCSRKIRSQYVEDLGFF